MRSEDDRGAELLAELLLGGRDPREPRVAQAFAADPELERRYRELRRTVRALDETHRFEDSLLRGAQAESLSSAAETNVERTLRDEAAPRSWKHWAFAVAAGLLIVAWMAFRERGTAPARTYLGDASSAPVPVEPVASVPAREPPLFRWTFAPDAAWNGHCEVVLYDEQGTELARSPEILAPAQGSTWEWRPSAQEWNAAASLSAVRWQVSVVSALGAVATSPPQALSLRP